jgi:pimeloyl-ACP methyl ester carboxylesterase
MAAPSQLVLLPGLLCDADLWHGQTESLSSSIECRVADLTQGETIEALAETVLNSAAPTFALAGFSFGGYVAQEIMRMEPDRVERLALLDTSFRADSAERQASRRALAAAALQPGRFEGITRRILPDFVHPDRLDDAILVDQIRTMTQRVGRDVFARQSMMPRQDGENVLRGLSCPALILCGRQDTLTPFQVHEEMASIVPNSTLCVIEHCGHMSPMERPAEVTKALSQWLEV